MPERRVGIRRRPRRPVEQHHLSEVALTDPAAVDPRFIASDESLDLISEVVAEQWPERIAPEDLLNPQLWEQIEEARELLLERLDLSELV